MAPAPHAIRLAERGVVLGAIGALHLAGLLAPGLRWQDPPQAGLQQIEVVSLADLGLAPMAAKPQAVPAALPAVAPLPAVPPVAPPLAPAPDFREAVGGADAPLPMSQSAAVPPPAPSLPTAPVAEAPPPPSHEVMVQYATLVAQQINRLKFYPAKARSGLSSGVAEVRFELDAAGAVIAAHIARSSGDAALDAAALQMVRAADLPAPPTAPFKGRIAIDFRIRK